MQTSVISLLTGLLAKVVELSGFEIGGGTGCATARDFHIRTSNIVSASAPAKTANGMIQATRLKPVVVGAANTVLPYFCTKLCSTRESLSPRSMPAISSLRMRSEYVQPTWLHSSKIWLQPHMHIRPCPSLLKRASVSAPKKVMASSATRTTWAMRSFEFRVSSFKLGTSKFQIVIPKGGGNF